MFRFFVAAAFCFLAFFSPVFAQGAAAEFDGESGAAEWEAGSDELGADGAEAAGASLLEGQDPEELFRSFLDSANKIRLLQSDAGLFSAREDGDGGRRLTNFSDGKFQRRFYDKSLRLEKIEYWAEGDSSAESLLERTIEFGKAEADGSSSVFERNFLENSEKRSFFLPNGALKSERTDRFDKDGALVSFDAFTCQYDAAGRSVQERLQKYSVEKGRARLLSDEIFRSVYSGERLAESAYYRNSVLRVRTIYQDQEKGDWARMTYFDGGIVVRDFYRDNKKVGSERGGAAYER